MRRKAQHQCDQQRWNCLSVINVPIFHLLVSFCCSTKLIAHLLDLRCLLFEACSERFNFFFAVARWLARIGHMPARVPHLPTGAFLLLARSRHKLAPLAQSPPSAQYLVAPATHLVPVMPLPLARARRLPPPIGHLRAPARLLRPRPRPATAATTHLPAPVVHLQALPAFLLAPFSPASAVQPTTPETNQSWPKTSFPIPSFCRRMTAMCVSIVWITIPTPLISPGPCWRGWPARNSWRGRLERQQGQWDYSEDKRKSLQ